VIFGANPATEVDVLGPTQLFVTVPPAAAAGTVAVTVTNPDGTPSPPLSNGFTYLADVTVSVDFPTLSALGTIPGNSKAVAWVDYDGDGDLDLDFTIDVANQLYRNEGNGTFTNVSGPSGIADGVFNANSATWGDFNNDGCVDLYMVNPPTASNILFRNNCNGTFTDVTTAAGVAGRASGSGARDAAWADYDNDGFLDLFVANDDASHTDQLLHNNKNGMFTDVTTGSGITNLGITVNANWGDFDGDGYPDLFLVRSGTQSDILYRNNQNGTFTDVTASSGILDTPQGTDAVWGDFNNDGRLDLYVIGATGVNHIFQHNAGTNTFTDISTPGSFQNAGNTFGSAQAAAVGDLDNDGRLDIFIAQANDGRTNSWLDIYLQNNGGSPPTFNPFTTNDPSTFSGTAVAFGDYTRDGNPDFFVGGLSSGTDYLTRNLANRNDWLIVRLVGRMSNRLGIGARVSVTADLDGDPGTPDVTQTREIIGGSKGQSAIEADFGLGRTAVERRKVSNLTVFWPTSGTTQSFNNLAVDQIITVFEGPANLTVTSVAPSSGPAAGGTTVVVSGENFAPDATVTIGGVLVAVVNRTGTTSITVTSPAHGAGLVDVTVTNPSRPVGDPLRQGTLTNGFLYFDDVQQSLFVFDRTNTTLVWGTVLGQQTYDAIRGNLSSLHESAGQVTLGAVVCLENDSADTTTAPDHVDLGVPPLGQGFFYLVRFSGSYGASSAGSVEVPTSGDCP